MARKIEYKNLVQEVEATHADVAWWGVFRAFSLLKMFLFCFREKASLLGALFWATRQGSIFFFFCLFFCFVFKGR